MATLKQTLDRYNGIGPGFDFLRIALAVSIVLAHATLQTDKPWLAQRPFWFVQYGLVPMFFALSGFLVAGSAMRLTLKNFLINRGMRIIPALAVDVIFCALVIGPLMTTMPLAEYFSDGRFARYFLNVTGWIHYRLPGVFETHPNYRVNGALWTVPYEMLCYVLMSAFIVSRWIHKPARIAATVAAFFAIGLFIEKAAHGASGLDIALRFVFVERGAQLLMSFCLGILAYQLRERIPYSRALFLVCCAICLASIFILRPNAMNHVANRIILLPALTYMTVFIGLSPVPVPKLVHRGDYSYGIYLYHDPLLQVVIALAPLLVLGSAQGTLILAAIGLTAVSLFAAFSWHCIEKPILGLRKRFSFVARVRGVASNEDASVAPALPAKAPAPGFPTKSDAA